MDLNRVKEGDLLEYLGEDTSGDTEGELTIGKVYEVIEAYDETVIISTDNDSGWSVGYYTDNLDCFKHIPVDVDREIAQDAVNSPSHYNSGKFETIDIIEQVTVGYENPFVAYCLGNVVKYMDRAPYKHETPSECLKKAAWYLNKAVEALEKEDKETE